MDEQGSMDLCFAPTPGGITSSFVIAPCSSVGQNRLYTLPSQ